MSGEPRNLHVVGVIQARMGSTRLPGKVMQEVHGLPRLGHMLLRVKRAKKLDRVVVATTDRPEDDAIAAFCEGAGIALFRGSSDDVLDRIYHCAHAHVAETIVRMTADCPLIDSMLIDEVVNYYLSNQDRFDYVSNTLDRSFPRGMDVEVFSLDTLNTVFEAAKDPFEREHVTLHIVRSPKLFRIGSYCYRLTVDTEEDARLVDRLLGELKVSDGLPEIASLLREHGDWVMDNVEVMQKIP